MYGNNSVAAGAVMTQSESAQLQGGSGSLRGGLTSVPAPMTRLESAHAGIEVALDSLRERVGMLASRMGGVLQPPYPTETAGNAANGEKRASSPAVDSAERLGLRVRGIEQTVIDLLERLEA